MEGRDQDRAPVGRREFENYVTRHEDNPYAHSVMTALFQVQGLTIRENFENRIGSLEAWRDRIIGAVAMLTFLVTAGVVAAVVELLRR